MSSSRSSTVPVAWSVRFTSLCNCALVALSSNIVASKLATASANLLLFCEITVAPADALSPYLSLTSWITNLSVFRLIFVPCCLFAILIYDRTCGNTCLVGASYIRRAGLRRACAPLANDVSGHITFGLSITTNGSSCNKWGDVSYISYYLSLPILYIYICILTLYHILTTFVWEGSFEQYHNNQ